MKVKVFEPWLRGTTWWEGQVEIRFEGGWRSLRMTWADKDEKRAIKRGPAIVEIVKGLGENVSANTLFNHLMSGHINVTCIFFENIVKDDYSKRRTLR